MQTTVSEFEQAGAEKFYRALGFALTRWSQTESLMEHMFRNLTGLSHAVSARVFHSANSFRGRYQMLSSVLAIAKGKPGVVDALKAIVNKANNYSAFRNTIAHESPMWGGVRSDPTSGHFRIMQSASLWDGKTTREPLLLEHVETGGENIRLLNVIFSHAANAKHEPQLGSPERLQLLLDLLPNLAHERRVAPSDAEQFWLGVTRIEYPL